ncbi:hypothetical protein SAMN05192544_1025108 [Paraburkholderia hospita]|nr:hypothetical protein SAMN05192544_1025108 [Paraburkholderia hospita]
MNLVAFEIEEKRSATAQIFKSLAMEMLELAALDLSRAEPDALDRTSSAAARRADRQSALLWLSEKGDRGVVTFGLCCDALNVPIDPMRVALLTAPSQVLAQIRTILQSDTQSAAKADSNQSRRRALSCPL